MDKLEPGIFFLGHDSISGIITTNAGPYLSLTTPRGGERFERGATCRIAWTAYQIEHLKIEYSTNRGSTWTTIADRAAASAGLFDWRVPSIVSDHCFIRITDVSNAGRNDRNDTAFSIVMPSMFRNSMLSTWRIRIKRIGHHSGRPCATYQREPIEVGDCIGIFTPRGSLRRSPRVGRHQQRDKQSGATIRGGWHSRIHCRRADALQDLGQLREQEYVVNATYSQGSNVFAADGFYAVNTLENQSIQSSISLSSGWNLISLPLMVSNWSMESVLSSYRARVVAVKNGAGNI
jgi:hypothetical protein